MGKTRKLLDEYRLPGCRPKAGVRGVLGETQGHGLFGWNGSKKTVCGCCGTTQRSYSDLLRRRPIWFGEKDRSQESMDKFYAGLGPKKSKKMGLAVSEERDDSLRTGKGL